MTNPELLGSSGQRPQPPERFHVFVSYTTREEEVRIVKPIVDNFLNSVLRPVIEQTIGEPPAFYDGYWLYNPKGSRFSYSDLRSALKFAIEESEVLVAFISPEYFGSEWCRFECSRMAFKKLRPWFDICRRPPITELRDRRPADMRPHWLECLHARFLMRRWQLQKRSRKPGGAIVPVLWKGKVDPFVEMPEVGWLPLFDWRGCVQAVEAWVQVSNHVLRHGSVSPSWEEEARVLDRKCQESMKATAFAIVEILRQRRLEYAHRK